MVETNTASPLTLAEFDREARKAACRAVAFAISEWEAGKIIEAVRPLVLRLLAGERERRAEEAAALGDRTTAHAIRNMGDPE